MKKIITYIIFAALLAVFIFRSDYDFRVILNADLPLVLLLGFTILLSYCNTYFSVDAHFRILSVNDSRLNIMLLSLASNLLNYLPAKGGVISLGTFLKVKKKVPVNRFIFVTILGYIIVTAVTVAVSMFFLFDEKMLELYRRIDLTYLMIFAAVVICALFISVTAAKKNRGNYISRYYLLFLSNRQIIRGNELNILYLIFTILGGITLFSLRMYFAFRIAGHEISMYHALMTGVIANLSFFLSFTPGGLGVKESFVGGISYLLFGSAELGIVASLADRAVNLILTIITGTYAVRKLDRRYFTKQEVAE
ncbi:MAG TPA: lysylphosphatidylglycerol synthase domain-containing protein [Clostridiales bacterium]|nr:lysylphosphatidylglycerol synthase domain-containing protein [Clostridiales bacterium]